MPDDPVTPPTEPTSAAGDTLLSPPVTPPAEPPKDPATSEPPKEPAKTEEPSAFDVTKLTLPEGIKLDETQSKAFSDIMIEAKVPQEAAQRLMDLYGSEVKKVSDGMLKTWTDTNNKWREEVKADPEIGGDKLDATLQTISKAIDTYGSAKTRDAFNLTGAGNNPEIIRFLAKIARATTEASHVPGNPPGAVPKSLAELMYPKSEGN